MMAHLLIQHSEILKLLKRMVECLPAPPKMFGPVSKFTEMNALTSSRGHEASLTNGTARSEANKCLMHAEQWNCEEKTTVDFVVLQMSHGRL